MLSGYASRTMSAKIRVPTWRARIDGWDGLVSTSWFAPSWLNKGIHPVLSLCFIKLFHTLYRRIIHSFAFDLVIMLSKSILVSLFASHVVAAGVTGTPSGFAAATTGGGDAEPVTPTSTEELVSYLTDDQARVIILNKEFNFIGTEGETTEDGCRPDSNTCPGDGGQDAINGANWVGFILSTHRSDLSNTK